MNQLDMVAIMIVLLVIAMLIAAVICLPGPRRIWQPTPTPRPNVDVAGNVPGPLPRTDHLTIREDMVV